MSVSSSRRSSAASVRSRCRTADILSELENAPNPFTMPSDEEVFVLREEERARKLEERKRLHGLRVHEKTTWGTRQAATKINRGIEPYELELSGVEGGSLAQQDPPQKIVRGAKDKESMSDFILKKREMFLVQMSLGTKREEIQKLEQRAHARDLALKESEEMLLKDDERFQQFIRENDEQAHEAIKRAEAATKARNQRMQEIKQLKAEIKGVEAEISKVEDKLEDCKSYRAFLLKCTPDDWHSEQKYRLANKRAVSRVDAEEQALASAAKAAAEDMESAAAAEVEGSETSQQSPAPAPQLSQAERKARIDQYTAEELDKIQDDELPLYFKEAEELSRHFTDMEEHNLFLMQNCQDAEVMFEELMQQHDERDRTLTAEADNLKVAIEELRGQINTEQNRIGALQGQAAAAAHDPELEGQEEHFKRQTAEIRKLFLVCYPEQASASDDLGAIEMLTRIEKKIEETFSALSTMERTVQPDGKLWDMEKAEKGKLKERRQIERVRLQAEAQRAQEERIKRSLVKAQLPVVKKTGKPIMFRSAPPQRRKRVKDTVQDDEEELDRQYFFS